MWVKNHTKTKSDIGKPLQFKKQKIKPKKGIPMSLESMIKQALQISEIKFIKISSDEDGNIIFDAVPYKKHLNKCPICGKKCHVYDLPKNPTSWRLLDIGSSKAYIRYLAPRVQCPEHGVHVCAVPWAEHKSRFSYAFEDTIAWLLMGSCVTRVAEFMRINWHSVERIIKRVMERKQAELPNILDNLVNIGIDETSYKKGHKDLTVIIDHDTRSVVWVKKGKSKAVLESFFNLLSEEQKTKISVVTGDGARWIKNTVLEQCANADFLLDPFHVMMWMSEALDKVRKASFKELNKEYLEQCSNDRHRSRGRPKKGDEKPKNKNPLAGTKYLLLKNKESLSDSEEERLTTIMKQCKDISKAYFYKESLRDIFKSNSIDQATRLLSRWIRSASHCSIKSIKELSKKISRHKDNILQTIEKGYTNARLEAMNNKIKLSIRLAYGFRNIESLIAMIMLRCSRVDIQLPGRLKSC